MDQTVIMRDAFKELIDLLGGDIEKLLEKLERKTPGRPVPTHGEKKGARWTCKGKSCILLEVDEETLRIIQRELDDFLARKSTQKPHYYFEDGKLITYKTKATIIKGNKVDDKFFLLFEDWKGDERNICKIINDLAGKDIISGERMDEMIKNEKASTTKRKLGPKSPLKTIVPVSPLASIIPKSLPLNLILYGPPGTGKTYHTVNKALEILTGKDWSSAKREDAIDEYNRFKDVEKRIVFTTFHQSMSYEDFIEGIKPNLDGKSIGYKIEDGIFKQIANTAKENSGKPYVLIIDEINRGNVANIFGELITLIEDDKRTTKYNTKTKKYDKNLEGITVKLPYSKEEFGVPGNLYIIGTMNTADRSVEALDSALRRRFSFEEMMPVPELLESVTIDGTKITLAVLLRTINDRIEVLKDREHQIGHSYFMEFVKKDAAGNVVKSTVSPDNLKTVFTDKIIPLLQEYFYGDYEKIQLVVGKGFVKEENNKPHFAVKNIEVYIPEKRFSIIDPDMKDALEKLFNPKDAAE